MYSTVCTNERIIDMSVKTLVIFTVPVTFFNRLIGKIWVRSCLKRQLLFLSVSVYSTSELSFIVKEIPREGLELGAISL